MGLDRDVQSRNRLVADDELRVGGERPCDADALPLAAGELVGVPVDESGVQAHQMQQLPHLRIPLFAGGQIVGTQWLADNARYGHARVE